MQWQLTYFINLCQDFVQLSLELPDVFQSPKQLSLKALPAVLNKKRQEQISVIKQLLSPRCPLNYSIIYIYRIGAGSAEGTHKIKKTFPLKVYATISML